MPENERDSMSIREAGRKGGEATRREHGPEFYRRIGGKGGSHSWTSDPAHAKVPELSDEDRRRAEELKAKLGRGEDLTMAEAGFLGGVRRVEQARARDVAGRSASE